jgi:hypothetical protein
VLIKVVRDAGRFAAAAFVGDEAYAAPEVGVEVYAALAAGDGASAGNEPGGGPEFGDPADIAGGPAVAVVAALLSVAGNAACFASEAAAAGLAVAARFGSGTAAVVWVWKAGSLERVLLSGGCVRLAWGGKGFPYEIPPGRRAQAGRGRAGYEPLGSPACQALLCRV